VNTKFLLEISALSSLVVALFAINAYVTNKGDETATKMLADQARLKALDSAVVFPASTPVDPLFSNYGRRVDLFAPPTLAINPLLYGQTVPT
jgi:hypothetical protein